MGSTNSTKAERATILHPTDFTGGGELAFAHALRIALEAKQALSLLRVKSEAEVSPHVSGLRHVIEVLVRWKMLSADAPASTLNTELDLEVSQRQRPGRQRPHRHLGFSRRAPLRPRRDRHPRAKGTGALAGRLRRTKGAAQDRRPARPGGSPSRQRDRADFRRRPLAAAGGPSELTRPPTPPQYATCITSPRRSGLKRITMTIATATTPATSASANL